MGVFSQGEVSASPVGGRPATRLAWHAGHRSGLADLFRFRRAIDSVETGRDTLETGAAPAVVLTLLAVYYRSNDRTKS